MAVLVVTNALSAGVCALVLSQGTFISMTSSGHAGDAQIITILNWAIFSTLLLAVLISAATVVVNLVKLVRSGDQEALNGHKMKAQ